MIRSYIFGKRNICDAVLKICSNSKETTSKQQMVFVDVSDAVVGSLLCCGVGIAKFLQSFKQRNLVIAPMQDIKKLPQ